MLVIKQNLGPGPRLQSARQFSLFCSSVVPMSSSLAVSKTIVTNFVLSFVCDALLINGMSSVLF